MAWSGLRVWQARDKRVDTEATKEDEDAEDTEMDLFFWTWLCFFQPIAQVEAYRRQKHTGATLYYRSPSLCNLIVYLLHTRYSSL